VPAAPRPVPCRPLLCVIHGPTAGRNWEQASARRQLARTVAAAGVRRRIAPHQLRHAHAVELAHEEIPLVVIQRSWGMPTSALRRSSTTPPSRVRPTGRLRASGPSDAPRPCAPRRVGLRSVPPASLNVAECGAGAEACRIAAMHMQRSSALCGQQCEGKRTRPALSIPAGRGERHCVSRALPRRPHPCRDRHVTSEHAVIAG
jgi:hypothetical protein